MFLISENVRNVTAPQIQSASLNMRSHLWQFPDISQPSGLWTPQKLILLICIFFTVAYSHAFGIRDAHFPRHQTNVTTITMRSYEFTHGWKIDFLSHWTSHDHHISTFYLCDFSINCCHHIAWHSYSSFINYLNLPIWGKKN